MTMSMKRMLTNMMVNYDMARIMTGVESCAVAIVTNGTRPVWNLQNPCLDFEVTSNCSHRSVSNRSWQQHI